MAGSLAPPIYFQGYTSNGSLNAFGFVATYAAGSTTPIATYTDATLATANLNPVPLNAIGEAPIWLTPGLAYKFVETDQFGNQCGYADQIVAPIAGGAVAVNLLPAVTNTYNIGSPTFTWANGYFGTNLYIAGLPVYDVTSGGIGYTPITAAETAAAVTPTDYYYQPGDIRRYGAVMDGVTNNTAALTSAFLQDLNNGYAIYIPAGKCVGTLTITGGIGIHVRGEGMFQSEMIAPSATADVIVITGPCVGLIIEELFITAAATSTAGNGIHFSGVSPSSNVVLRDLYISNFGRSGVYDAQGIFTSYLENVQVIGTGYHNIDIAGDNTVSLRNCYAYGAGDPAHNLPTSALQPTFTANLTAGAISGTLASNWLYPSGVYVLMFSGGDQRPVNLTQGATTATWTTALSSNSSSVTNIQAAGYRIHGAQPVMINCNCLNQGSTGMVFSNNVPEDVTLAFCTPMLINCNIEDFTTLGIRNKQSTLIYEGTQMIGFPGSVAIQIEPNVTGALGTLDGDLISSNTATSIAVVFTVPPTGSSGGTLTGVWGYASGSWPVTLSTTQVIIMGFTWNSTTVTWTTAITGSPTVNATTPPFKNGYAVHTALVTGRPFTQVASPRGANQFTWFDDVAAQAVSMTTWPQYPTITPGGGTTRFAAPIYDLNVLGQLHQTYAGTQALAGVTTQAVTFAVAAATATYTVALSQSATSVLPPWITAKATTGFTINFSANYTGSVDWSVTF